MAEELFYVVRVNRDVIVVRTSDITPIEMLSVCIQMMEDLIKMTSFEDEVDLRG